jgi:phosphate transport system permease protein
MSGALIAGVAFASLGAGVLGYRRAQNVAKVASLHSRPIYHAAWLTACVLIAPVFLVCITALLEPWILQRLLITRFPSLAQLNAAEIQLFFRDVTALSTGGISAISDALRQEAAEAVRGWLSITSWMRITVILAVMLAGFLYGWRRITADFRARAKIERLIQIGLFCSAGIAVLTTAGIVFSLLFETLRFFQFVPVTEFLFGLQWSPQTSLRPDQIAGSGAFGIVPLFAGTFLIMLIAMSVATPLGLLSAIYLSEYASPKVRAAGKPMLEILAGIPSVVYGFFAALIVGPFIRDVGQGLGLNVATESALAAGLVMGIMIVPFISSLSDDILNAVPQTLRDGALAIGATPAETTLHVVLPAALPGIVSALLLAVSRALGETMIVVMAAGMAANLTFNPLAAVTTVTVQITSLLVGDVAFDSPKTLSAFALAFVLFLVTMLLNLVALKVVRRYRAQYE